MYNNNTRRRSVRERIDRIARQLVRNLGAGAADGRGAISNLARICSNAKCDEL
jgi:hypothetical protein